MGHEQKSAKTFDSYLTGVCFVFALCGFSWDSAIAKRRVKQCAVLSGGHLG